MGETGGYWGPDPRQPDGGCDVPGIPPPAAPEPPPPQQQQDGQGGGVPGPQTYPGPIPDCPITQACMQAGAIVQRCSDKITGHCSMQCDDAQSTIDRCDSVIRGQIAEYCQTCQDTIDKKIAKLESWLVQQLSRVYALLAPMGVTLPTEPELQQVGASGSRPYYPTGTAPDATQQPGEAMPPGSLPAGYQPPPIQPYVPGMVPSSPSPQPYQGKGCVEIDLCPDLYAALAGWWKSARPYLVLWWAFWLRTRLLTGTGEKSSLVGDSPPDEEKPPPEPPFTWQYPALPIEDYDPSSGYE
jgi:hypothetical protein